VIRKFAGSDATATYSEVHTSNLISDTLGQSKRVGLLDLKSVDEEWEAAKLSKRPEEPDRAEKPPLESLINSFDLEEVASRTLSKKAWAFYSSAATDLITHRANRDFFDRIWFRPRGLVDVRRVSTETRMLGRGISMPLWAAPAALARLAHDDGEKALARACARMGIPLCVCFSCHISETGNFAC
jgi:L-lactate dehydrogenase (cytochrome)